MIATLQAYTSGSTALYEKDIIAWSKEQARLLQAGRLSELDIEHIVEEIKDVGMPG